MKTYRGEPGGRVTVHTERGVHDLVPGLVFEWGKSTPLSAALALALVGDLLNDPYRAERLHRRVMYRTVMNWKADSGWQCSDDDLRTVIADIEKVAVEMAPHVKQAARERPVPVSDAAPMGGGWTSNPKLDDPKKGGVS